MMTMHTRSFPVFIALIVFLCSVATRAAAAPLQVVATLPDLGALVRDIGGDAVRVTVLASPDEDPHFVDPRPSYAVELHRADLLVLNGLDLEIGWLPSLIRAARNPALIRGNPAYFDASEGIAVLEAGMADRSQGDVHPLGNPHYLTDLRQGLTVARRLAERLSQLAPQQKTLFSQRLAQLIDAARPLLARAANLRQKHLSVLAYHQSLSYLEDWLGMTQTATVEPKPGIPPSPKRLVELVHLQDSNPAAMILQEAYYPDKLTRLLADKLDIPLVVISGGASPGQSYLERIEALMRSIEEAAP
ncbi:MAG: zinc ABC transporter substrate-binding protein [Candidatus Dadabacteria bacterium]|nr:MAG: zinc ABC transporter substrate-binding protein [Candidatus Dadabacteria bacterium]